MPSDTADRQTSAYFMAANVLFALLISALWAAFPLYRFPGTTRLELFVAAFGALPGGLMAFFIPFFLGRQSYFVLGTLCIALRLASFLPMAWPNISRGDLRGWTIAHTMVSVINVVLAFGFEFQKSD